MIGSLTLKIFFLIIMVKRVLVGYGIDVDAVSGGASLNRINHEEVASITLTSELGSIQRLALQQILLIFHVVYLEPRWALIVS